MQLWWYTQKCNYLLNLRQSFRCYNIALTGEWMTSDAEYKNEQLRYDREWFGGFDPLMWILIVWWLLSANLFILSFVDCIFWSIQILILVAVFFLACCCQHQSSFISFNLFWIGSLNWQTKNREFSICIPSLISNSFSILMRFAFYESLKYVQLREILLSMR